MRHHPYWPFGSRPTSNEGISKRSNSRRSPLNQRVRRHEETPPSSFAYSLGPLPWSDEVLVAAVWKSFQDARRFVDEHPGRDIADRSSSLQSVLRILEGAAKSFCDLLARFREEAHGGHLFRRNRRRDLNAYEAKLQELLYLFASSAMTLVEQARALSKKVELPGYEKRVRSSFADNPRHRFVQELRNDLIHVTLHQPSWQLTSGRDEEPTSKFILRLDQLARSSDYNALARAYIRDHPKGIDLGALIEEYVREVKGFQKWLNEALNNTSGSLIADYRRCSNRINAVSSYSWWNIIVQQVILVGKRDPYRYLDQYLTPQELVEVNSLPFKSKAQVDRIIELVDEFGACDLELRALIYKAFGTSDA